ncbi:hypothetical protein [uncultured Clostridium sp.]|uniref:hypothetical protein n=1 Tax=uncultured Clostridium sp. TaxID=59620 RepID=UPI00262E0F98|nr:hypothetical protein [uncultured Clostridium sp.]
MNKKQKQIIRVAKIQMRIEKLSFYKARKKVRKELRSIGDMLVKKYGFKRK